MALPRLSPGVSGPSARFEDAVTDTDESDTQGDETREVPIPVPPDVSEEEVQEAAEAAEEALPEDAEAVVGETETGPPDPDGPDDMQRTIEQLRSEGDPNEVERTPVLESGNLDVAPDEWPLGFPLQGITRLAAVVNLNYIYNEQRERWERDEGNRQAVGKTVIDDGQATVPAGFLTIIDIVDKGPSQILDDNDAVELRASVVPRNGEVEFYSSVDDNYTGGLSPLRYALSRSTSATGASTRLFIGTGASVDIDVDYAVIAE